MCFIELVDFNEIYNVDTVKKKTRRSKRSDNTTVKKQPIKMF